MYASAAMIRRVWSSHGYDILLTRCSRAKIAMARPNETDLSPKSTAKVRLGIYGSQIRPSDWHVIVVISGRSVT